MIAGEENIVRPEDRVTMPKDLTRGGDIQINRNFNVGGYGGDQVYESRGRVVGTRGEYDSRGKKKRDKTHVSLGLNFEVHPSVLGAKIILFPCSEEASKTYTSRGRFGLIRLDGD